MHAFLPEHHEELCQAAGRWLHGVDSLRAGCSWPRRGSGDSECHARSGKEYVQVQEVVFSYHSQTVPSYCILSFATVLLDSNPTSHTLD